MNKESKLMSPQALFNSPIWVILGKQLKVNYDLLKKLML